MSVYLSATACCPIAAAASAPLTWPALATLGGLLALAYVFVGYPLFLAIATRLRRQPAHPPVKTAAQPTISVIVCARNEAPRIQARLRNLLDQSLAPSELIVISDGSADPTAELARQTSPAVTVLEFPDSRGKAFRLSAAVPQCKSDIVVLADARQTFGRDAIRHLAAGFADPAIGAVSGELVIASPTDHAIGQGVDLYWRYEKWLRKQEAAIDSTCGCTGAIYAIRRHLFEPIDPRTILDDVAIPMRFVRQGYRVAFEDRAIATDQLADDPGTETRRKIRTLAGCWQLIRLEPWILLPWRNRIWFAFLSHKLLRLAAPFLLAATLAAHLTWAASSTFARWILVPHLAAYALALAEPIIPPALRRGPLRLASLCRAFLVLNATAALGLVQCCRQGNAGTWVPTRNKAS